MAEVAGARPPSLEQALAWRGFELDDLTGRRVGRVEGVYADAERDVAAWLTVSIEGRRRFLRRRSARVVALPVRECAAFPGRVWTAQPLETIRKAPAVDPSRLLLREHEATICAHYGVGAGAGRHAEVAARERGAVTARPA